VPARVTLVACHRVVYPACNQSRCGAVVCLSSLCREKGKDIANTFGLRHSACSDAVDGALFVMLVPDNLRATANGQQRKRRHFHRINRRPPVLISTCRRLTSNNGLDLKARLEIRPQTKRQRIRAPRSSFKRLLALSETCWPWQVTPAAGLSPLYSRAAAPTITQWQSHCQNPTRRRTISLPTYDGETRRVSSNAGLCGALFGFSSIFLTAAGGGDLRQVHRRHVRRRALLADPDPMRAYHTSHHRSPHSSSVK